MAGLQVVSTPNQPTLAPTVAPAPTGVPTGPLPVVNRPAAPQPAKLPVVSQPANVQPSLSVQPLPQQPSIYVPPKPPEPPQMDKIASDIGVARGRGADDTTILYSLVKKNPVLTQDVKVAIQERKATPTQVLDAIVAKHTPQPEQPAQRTNFQTFTDPTVGVLKSFGQVAKTISDPVFKPLNYLYEKVTGSKPLVGGLTKEDVTPVGAGQKVGKVIGNVGQNIIAAGVTAPLNTAIAATTAKTALPALSKTLINTFGRSVVEGVTALGISKLQGADNKDAATNALIAGAIPWAGAALNGLKGEAGKVANKIETSIIKPTQADIKDGFKTQNIFKYDLGGTLQQTAQKTNDKIVELSAQLDRAIKGSDKKVNVSGLLNQVKNILEQDKGKTFGANTKIDYAVRFFREELAQVTENGSVSLSEAQQMKRAVGKLGAWYYGARDPESNAIETVANHLYTKIRLAIENTSPKEVAGINKQLSELIPIENAIIRRVPIAERGNIFGLSDIVTALPAVENIKNPANWWLFAINRLSKSGRVANVLSKGAKTPEVRGATGTAIFGPTKAQVEKSPTVSALIEKSPFAKMNVGLSIKNVEDPKVFELRNTWQNLQKQKVKLLNQGLSENSPSVKNLIKALKRVESQVATLRK